MSDEINTEKSYNIDSKGTEKVELIYLYCLETFTTYKYHSQIRQVFGEMHITRQLRIRNGKTC